MNIADRTRALYTEKIKRKSSGEIDGSIQMAEDFRNLIGHPGWKRIDEFMTRQRQGSEELLDHEMGSLSILSIPRLFNSFLKYIYILSERRAYGKIRNYIRISIQKGEQNAERKRKTEEAKSREE